MNEFPNSDKGHRTLYFTMIFFSPRFSPHLSLTQLFHPHKKFSILAYTQVSHEKIPIQSIHLSSKELNSSKREGKIIPTE